jgi:hypothetical protein
MTRDPSRVQIIAVGDRNTGGSILKKFGQLHVYDFEGKKPNQMVPLRPSRKRKKENGPAVLLSR